MLLLVKSIRPELLTSLHTVVLFPPNVLRDDTVWQKVDAKRLRIIESVGNPGYQSTCYDLNSVQYNTFLATL